MNLPTVLVIFGVTGDLTARKLMPALYDLFKKDLLPENFTIIGFSRRDLSNNDFRDMMSKTVDDYSKWERFSDLLTYHKGNFDNSKDFAQLEKVFVHSDSSDHVCTNKLLYLATPPRYYHTILNNLDKHNLTKTCGEKIGWTRILIEKPFGNNLKTAQKLDLRLANLFHERQIYRIDHYLGKDALQNVLAFRFGNPIFEPVWNRNYIDRVGIKIMETIGVGSRGAFYDEVGALRDMGQNHLLQMLAITAMEAPYSFESEAVRDERSKVLKAMRVIEEREVNNNVVRGQYKGYNSEKGVKKESLTETFFRAKLFIDNERWQGVPFYIKTGKKMSRDLVQITVYFKEVPHHLFKNALRNEQNFIRFVIQPNQSISVGLFVKQPGLQMQLDPQALRYDYSNSYNGEFGNPYEKVLLDCLQGDQTLFARTDGIMAAWKIMTPILNSWEKSSDSLFYYEKDSEGPKQMYQLDD